MASALDGWKFMAIMVKAAQDAGIDLEKAFKFMALISIAQEADKAGAVEGPTKLQ